jgi:hypothetical protein
MLAGERWRREIDIVKKLMAGACFGMMPWKRAWALPVRGKGFSRHSFPDF